MYFGPRARNPARGPVRAVKIGCGPGPLLPLVEANSKYFFKLIYFPRGNCL